jgi:hypothetical protein
MAAINNLTSLRLALADWVARTELADSQLDLFINAAEMEMLHGLFDPTGRSVVKPLRCHRMEVVNQSFALSGEYTALPSGFLGFRTIKLNGTSGAELEFATPAVFNATYLSSDTSSFPVAYCVEGGQLRVGPNASATDTLSITYYDDPPNLVTAGENWICTNYPMAYLYGALRHLAIYIGMDGRLPFFQTAFISQLSAIHSNEKAIEFSGTALTSRILGVTTT